MVPATRPPVLVSRRAPSWAISYTMSPAIRTQNADRSAPRSENGVNTSRTKRSAVLSLARLINRVREASFSAAAEMAWSWPTRPTTV